MRIVSSIIVVIGLFTAVPAFADEEPDHAPAPAVTTPARADVLRERGSVVLDDVAGGTIGALGVTVGWFTIQSSTADHGQDHATSTLFRFAPSADVFVIDGLSLGGQVGLTKSSATMTSTINGVSSAPIESTVTTREIAPRIGYAFKLSDDLVFWPRVHVGFASSDADTGTPGIGILGASVARSTASSNIWSVGGDASFAFVLGRHAAIAAGPQLTYRYEKAKDDSGTNSTALDVGVRASLRVMF